MYISTLYLSIYIYLSIYLSLFYLYLYTVFVCPYKFYIFFSFIAMKADPYNTGYFQKWYIMYHTTGLQTFLAISGIEKKKTQSTWM